MACALFCFVRSSASPDAGDSLVMSEGLQRSSSSRDCKKSKAASTICTSGVGQSKSVSRSTSAMESRHCQPSIDSVRGSKREGFAHLKLFVKPGKREGSEDSSSTDSTPSPVVASADNSSAELHPSFRKKLVDVVDQRKWTLIQTRGTSPVPRYNHASALVGRKLVVIGGETESETRNDVQVLHLGKLSWSKIGVGDSAPSKGLPIKIGPAQELPNCRGHSLISWGKTVILIGGQMDPASEKVAVWSFDMEMDRWTAVVTKGEIPVARSGQTVTRAGSILIMFGGEDMKGRKMNDLNILDLKSLMWLPLSPSGKGPSPRARHVADMYDDRFLFIFGGETKSKISSDTFALDFDNMEWSKLKTKGVHPAPRAGHAGALVGSLWYIVGGESRVSGPLDTTVLDMSRMEWLVVAPACLESVASRQGLSLVFVHRKEKKFLVAFGGWGTQPSSAVQVLHIPIPDHAPRKTLAGLLELPSTPDSKAPARSSPFSRPHQGSYPSLMGSSIPCACVNVAKSNLDSVMDHRSSSQRSTTSRSVSDLSAELDRDSGLIPLRTRYAMTQSARMESMAKRSSSQNSSFDTSSRRSGSLGSSWDSASSSRRRDLVLPRLNDFATPSVAGAEESERQHQSAQRIIRGDLQSTEFTSPSIESGCMLSAEEMQITAPSVRSGLVVSSVGDAGTLLLKTHPSVPSRARPGKGGSQSSEFSGYTEAFVTGPREGEHTIEPTLTETTSSGGTYSSMSASASMDCPSPYSSFHRSIPDYERDKVLPGRASADYLEAELPESPSGNPEEYDEAAEMSPGGTPDVVDELKVLSNILIADCVEERSIAVSMLREQHERKLADAIRTGELLAGQCAEALSDRDEAERTLHTVRQSRQRIEGRLCAALKQIKDLEERLTSTEDALKESTNLVYSSRVEKLKLEKEVAQLSADLRESHKDLQSTRGFLIVEGTRAFQLQVELMEMKHKVHNATPQGLRAPCIQQQPILA